MNSLGIPPIAPLRYLLFIFIQLFDYLQSAFIGVCYALGCICGSIFLTSVI
jgi:hypothetical protein